MKLKSATIIAIAGAALLSIAGIYYTLTSFKIVTYNETLGQVSNVCSAIGPIMLIIFFAVLYSNQKEW